jgi:hypothetical protein
MGITLDGTVVAVLDEGSGSDSTVSDPETPLVAADEVAFLPRDELC